MNQNCLIFRGRASFAFGKAVLLVGLGSVATAAALGSDPRPANAALPLGAAIFQPLTRESGGYSNLSKYALPVPFMLEFELKVAVKGPGHVRSKSTRSSNGLFSAEDCHPSALAEVGLESRRVGPDWLERVAASPHEHVLIGGSGFLTLDNSDLKNPKDVDGAGNQKDFPKASKPDHKVTPSACARFRTLCEPGGSPHD